ncbi:LytR C-terminal domain-containing protein [Streptomyces durmitorensis]|uniref:LytR C-terminal domain-containing protein n=1 Tax=Streptomyces durmitorensis TaxID=319947 RepID=A0ABY4PXC6_9ACTN|nr:LytR C-terminal domain-containing protein [Streptomyces durmitorensis]UQT57618.1 LytR C-terminal domain-containing protein [Streptomyces durmitorensis]
MSMLTPPGMGGKYRITGAKYPRMRRPRGRRRIVLAVVASVVAVGLIGWGTLQLIDVFTGGSKATAASSRSDCAAKPDPSAEPTAPKALPKPGQVKVNVFNATPRGGLAKDVAAELKKRGFTVGKVDNAPKAYDKKVKGTGILLGAKTATDTALPVLGTQLAGTESRTDARKGGEVDLILGAKFKDLAKKEDADKALAVLAEPKPTSSPSSGKKDC